MVGSNIEEVAHNNLIGERTVQIVCLLLLNFLPYCSLIANYEVFPAYIVPFLNHPLARLVLLVLMLSQTATFLILMFAMLPQHNIRLVPKTLRHWFLASLCAIALSITTTAGPIVLLAVNCMPGPQNLFFTIMNHISQTSPGIWLFLIGNLVIVLGGVVFLGQWFIRAEKKHLLAEQTP